MGIDDILIGWIVDWVKDKIIDKKEENEWTKRFKETGEFFIQSPDTAEEFREGIAKLFSKENMKKIAKELKDENGYKFCKLLHDKLYGLMVQYDIPKIKAEPYIYNFIDEIICYIEKKDKEKTLEIYIGNWKNEQEKRYKHITEMLNEIYKTMEKLQKKILTHIQ